MAKIRMLGDKVAVKPDEPIKKSAGGILLPEVAQEKPAYGTVVAASEGYWQNGTRLPSEVKEGDRVCYQRYAGNHMTVGEETFLVLSGEEILAVIE